ncbi:MAG TPA: hypothetical protein VFV83_04615, partial [Chthoniobacteraceae bacterium]|nr:hypothetical protein [Chthoniobacteraceae bacterium]
MLTSRRRALMLALIFLGPILARPGAGARPPFRTGASPQHDGERAGGVFDGRPVERITLDKAITMTVTNNLDARIERTGIRIAHSRLRFAVGAFDPVFSVRTTREALRRLENVNDIRSADVVRQENFINDQFALTQAQINLQNALREQQGLPPIPALSRQETTTGFSGVTFDAQTARSSSSLEGRTPWGMRYGFEVEAIRLRNTFSGDARRVFPEYQTFAGITVVQPLLRNFGPAANLAEVRIARQNRKTQELEWRDKLAAAVQG